MPQTPPSGVNRASLTVTVHSPCRFEPLSLRERGFEEGGLNGYLSPSMYLIIYSIRIRLD
jgi:hypothetical protein